MIRSYLSVSILSVLLFLSAAANGQEGSFVNLLVVNAGDVDTLTRHQPAELGRDGAHSRNEAELLNKPEYCGAEPVGPRLEAFGLMLLTSAVKTGITGLLTAFEERIQRELAAHSVTYSAGAWRRLGASGADFRCLRLVRGHTRAGQSTVEFDLVMRVSVTRVGDAVEIEPLRLYYARPAPTRGSVNGRYGLAVSLAGHEVGAAPDDPVFDTVVLTESVALGEGGTPLVRYYGSLADGEAFASRRLTYVVAPDDIDEGLAPLMQLTATVGESGTPSRFLSAFARLYGDNREAIGDALIEMALTRVAGE